MLTAIECAVAAAVAIFVCQQSVEIFHSFLPKVPPSVPPYVYRSFQKLRTADHSCTQVFWLTAGDLTITFAGLKPGILSVVRHGFPKHCYVGARLLTLHARARCDVTQYEAKIDRSWSDNARVK